ncbi:MAG: hypothetical protein M3N52_02775 [Actinomycetota bacterium]|nr:hypothetical protein [Actinomycetota bacterium]
MRWWDWLQVLMAVAVFLLGVIMTAAAAGRRRGSGSLLLGALAATLLGAGYLADELEGPYPTYYFDEVQDVATGLGVLLVAGWLLLQARH